MGRQGRSHRKRRWQSGSRWWLVAAAWLAVGPVQAQYEPAKLPDPSRRWSVNMGVRGEYDDNIFTSAGNKVGSFKAIVDPELLANLPAEQSFVGFRYGYTGTYYENRPSNSIDNEHRVDLLFSHSFNPRLVLNLNDRFSYAVEPQLIDLQAGQPVEIRRRGDYLYNNLNGDLSFNISRRWQVKVSGEWERWDYQNNFNETNVVSGTTNIVSNTSDRNVYQGTLSLIYTINPRTSAGINYRFEAVQFTDPGPRNERDSNSHIVYGSLVHQFNPELSTQVNAGGEYREFGDGNSELGPFLDSSISYAYAKDSAASVGVRYAITTTDVSSYQSTDTASIFGRVTQQFTPKLSADFTATFALNTYRNPTQAALANNVREEVVSFGLNGHYQFTRWFSGEAGYSYELDSSGLSTTAANRDFDRNRVYLGGRMTY